MVLIVCWVCPDFQIQNGGQTMAANAILKTIKSDISWTKCAKKANEATFLLSLASQIQMERFLLCSETILTFKPKMAAQ